VGDYESTKRYVSSYLEVRDSSASAHKLLGQAYEALGQKEAAFNEYKTSLELEGRQDDLVLKGKKSKIYSFSFYFFYLYLYLYLYLINYIISLHYLIIF